MNPHKLQNAEQLLKSLHYPELSESACHNSKFDDALQNSKENAVYRKDQVEASLIWRAQTIASIQRGFVSAFAYLKSDRFYEAWCQLERCEIELLALKRYHIVSADDPHRIEYIERMIQRWQDLYPYKVFFSPELLKKNVVCSTCGSKVTPRANCGHEKFGIYDGEMCYHKVTEVEILGVSIVENPVQRYSVAFLSSDEDGNPRDHYNYGNVKFVAERLDSPFNGWDSHLTTRKISASQVAHLTTTDPCPCLSGKIFGDCCMGKNEMTVPHLQIQLYVQPNKSLPANELLL